MLQLNHDLELFLKLRHKLLVHRLLQSLDRDVLDATVVVRVLAFQYFAVVTLNTAEAHWV